MKLYTFLYCCCTFESSYATMSVHRTKAGAYKAMKKHKLDAYTKWYDDYQLYGAESRRFEYDFGVAWALGEIEVLD